MSLSGKKWIIQNENEGLNLMEKILFNRHINTDEKREVFFKGGLEVIHDPFLLKDMAKAIERIKQAVQNKEPIMIFGDYDIDGITATALLFGFLKKIGADVRYTLPNREEDGYGLKKYFIQRFKNEGIGLIITVDCGTSNLHEVTLANTLGMTVIVTDHHTIPEELPPAYAIINPHQKECHYPNRDICGSTIAYKLVIALSKDLMEDAERKDYLHRQLGIVALGVVGDCMPLTDENRVLVKYGLKSLMASDNLGIMALLESAGIETKKITSTTIGFQIGPRINAAGRLDRPDHALELILGNLNKAELLSQLNDLRRKIVELHLKKAIEGLREQAKIPNIIILWDAEWKAGLLGLIAGRIAEEFNRPAIIMQEKEDEFVASCRSVNDFDITQFLREEANDLFTAFGGHKMAGGFTLPGKNFESFLNRINVAAEKQINPDNFDSVLSIDCEIQPHEMTMEACDNLSHCEPFGQGNPEPMLMMKNIKILSIRPVGGQGEHLQFPIRCGEKTLPAIAFRFGKYLDKIDSNLSYDIAFNMEINEWNGNKKLQLKVVDLKQSRDLEDLRDA
ncbi:single-stranded-DNA-specific exonuclease RecJ [Candidatus Peregrinibacteria bacterium CG_4_10_14_0_2_um_filter_43_11]|nr:MAG: single-stranded-DNA-specific exonuclease RecJ [Candidatus Peregrinibacteria bacterium CG_4_10_14_0_2_um_filter_43_11]